MATEPKAYTLSEAIKIGPSFIKSLKAKGLISFKAGLTNVSHARKPKPEVPTDLKAAAKVIRAEVNQAIRENRRS